MNDALSPINDGYCSVRMRQIIDFFYWEHGSQDVRNVAESYDFCSVRNNSFKIFNRYPAVVIYWHDFEFAPNLISEKLPWNDVRMMLGISNHYFITRLNIIPPIAICHQVNCLGRALGKNDFVILFCIYK